MTNDTSLESSCALLLESAKKFAKIEFFIAKSSYIVKMFAKKIVQKMINYTFLKSPCSCHLNVQKVLQNFKYPDVYPAGIGLK